MDRWTHDFPEDSPPNSNGLKLAIGGAGLGAIALAALLFLTGTSSEPAADALRLSPQLVTALETVVSRRSPALAVDGRAQLLDQKFAAAMALRGELGPLANQEQALFALLNGQLDSGQGALHIESPHDLVIAANFARLRLDYGMSTQLLHRVIQQNPEFASDLWPVLADTLAEQGLVGGHASPLGEAVDIYYQLIAQAGSDGELALQHNSLGIALQGLARVTQNESVLEEAAIAFGDSLRLLPDSAPASQTASIQANLAAVLYDLSVIEPSETLLLAAEQALRRAMETGPDAALPGYQRQLAAVLLLETEQTITVERIDEVGALLTAAFAPDVPQSSASNRVGILMRYGDTLAQLGEQMRDASLLTRATTAYSDALALVDQRSQPMVWATIQVNLGTAHAGLTAMRANTHSYDAATTAFKAALTIYAAHNADIDWALTQNNLALTLESEATRIGDTNILNEAMRRYSAALDTLQNADEDLAAQVRYNLSMAEVRTVELQLRMSEN